MLSSVVFAQTPKKEIYEAPKEVIDKIKEEGKRVGVSAWIVKPPKPELLKQVAKHFCP